MFDHPSQMEPLFPNPSGQLSELAMEVVQKSAFLAGQLHPIAVKNLCGTLRLINSYYSNLIEGHKTHPIDISLSDSERILVFFLASYPQLDKTHSDPFPTPNF